MSVFWFLHRACVVLFCLFWLVVAVFVWHHRAALEPFWDMAELTWRYKPAPDGGVARLEGRGTRAYSATGFELRDNSGVAFNYGLAGVALAPGDASSPAEVKAFLAQARSNLQQLVVGRPVAIDVTLGNPDTRTGLGVVFAGETNVNLLTLSQGFGQLQREQIRSVPLRQQWDFVQAEWTARQRQLGLWQSNLAGLRLPDR